MNINHGITAKQLLDVLKAKHSEAVCVKECKTGRSWGGQNRRFDLWVLLKTWSPWTTIGYEIKVDRQDFLRDEKWREYLDYCHMFYFVCPPGVIQEAELPEGTGLLIGSKNARKLLTKRKAVRHEPDATKLNQLMSYILMSRVPEIVGNMHEVANYRGDQLEQVRYWLKQAEERQTLADMVQGHVRKAHDDSMKRLREAKRIMKQVESFRSQLANLGIEWVPEANHWAEDDRVRRMIADLRKGITLMEVEALRKLGEQMVSTSNKLKGEYYS